MLEIIREKVEQAIIQNGATPVGIQPNKETQMFVFSRRGIMMVMPVSQITYHTVKAHIQHSESQYQFPRCQCNRELPMHYKPGMKCISCLSGEN